MKIKVITTTIALALSAALGHAANLGVTTHHYVVDLGNTFFETHHTSSPNFTAYDQAIIHGPDGKTVSSGLYLHKSLTNTGTKIGETTPTSGGGSGGGGGGKLHGPMGETANGITAHFINNNGDSMQFFMADPWVCGTIIYRLENNFWKMNTSYLFPCPQGSPLPSSSLVAPSFQWKPEWMKEDG